MLVSLNELFLFISLFYWLFAYLFLFRTCLFSLPFCLLENIFYSSFMCNPGYELLGEEELICDVTEDGVGWNYPPPQCIGKYFHYNV